MSKIYTNKATQGTEYAKNQADQKLIRLIYEYN